MSRDGEGEDRGEGKGPTASDPETPGAEPGAIAAHAVKTTRGRAATTIEVELEPERIAGREDPEGVKEVIAELPSAEDDESAPRWDEQPLDRAADEIGDGGTRKVRYVATRYEGSDAAKFGIRVKVKTAAGTVAKDGVRVREADKPDDGT